MPATAAQVTFERILLATDLCPTSEVAFAFAVGLARAYESNLELVHVVDLSTFSTTVDTLEEPAFASMRRASQESLDRLAGRATALGPRTKVLEGYQAAPLILDEAVETNADLIVTGTSCKRGFSKLALGSTAEALFRAAPCPVLIVGPHVSPPSAGPLAFRRVLYVTDFSAQASKAAALAVALGQGDKATLFLCHVVSDREQQTVPLEDAQWSAALKALVPEAEAARCHPECIVQHGEAVAEIVGLAARLQADLIVLGARKASFWLEYVRTGLTPALLSQVSCPILAVS